jgi:co-chaperonin GroES (HSP10)
MSEFAFELSGQRVPTPQSDGVVLCVLDSEASIDNRTGIVTKTGDRMHKRGLVIAVGPGKRHPRTDALLPMELRVGDCVLYEEWRLQWHSGVGPWPAAGDLVLLREEAVVMVLDDPETQVDVRFRLMPEAPDDNLPASGIHRSSY